MPTICLKVSNETKELWVNQASGEGISLSEWIRLAAEARLAVLTPSKGATAGPFVPENASIDEEVTSAFKDYLRGSGATGTAIEKGPRSGQPGAPGNTETGASVSNAGEAGEATPPETQSSPAPAEKPETEEDAIGVAPVDADPGPGSPSESHSDPAASVSDKLAEARQALEGRPFKGPDFRPVKKKKR